MSSPRRIVVRLQPASDGDATHTPKLGSHEQLDPPTLYLEKLGDQWMRTRGEAQPGVKYILESLPVGYTLWQRPRPKDAKHLDKYLYGHPSRKAFDSPNRFFPHFQHLMDNGDNMGCPCTICSGTTGVLPKSASGSARARSSSGASSSTSSRPTSSHKQARQHTYQAQPEVAQKLHQWPIKENSIPLQMPAVEPAVSTQHKGRPKIAGVGMDTGRVDEEGTPDVYRNLINKLRRHGKIDESIEEPLSMDWRTEQKVLPDLLRKLKDDSQWVPRVGEVVLFVRELSDNVHIIRHPITMQYRMYEESTKLWLDHPVWEAGLVGQTPTERMTIEDICENGNKENSVINSGVRVEPLPNVNDPDKSLSKRHKYVPIRHTRPFVLWKELLRQVLHYHPTVLNAQVVTSVMSLVGKYRFKGTWPEAAIYCRGIYVGHEMLAIGDTVRLLPNSNLGQSTSTDILVIRSIRLKWSKLDNVSDNDWDDGKPYNSSIWVYGAAYTSDSGRMNKEWLSDAQPPAVADDYGEWYPLHPSSKELAVPYSRILGRLHERDAVSLWLNVRTNNEQLLDAGRTGLVEGRVLSRERDNRIASEPNANWYWADTRAQALDLHTVNGLDVSTRDQLRDPKEWRRKIKVMDGITNNKILPTAKPTGGPDLAGRNLRGFMAPALADLPVHNPFGKGSDEASTGGSASRSSTTSASSKTRVSKKRPSHVVSLSSDEEDGDDDQVNEEIRQAMKVVENGSVQAKKPRVTVSVGQRQPKNS